MPEDSENWALLQALFHLVETTPEPDRERVLCEHCNDPELRRRVTAMIYGSGLSDDRTDKPADASCSGKIGPYSLIRLLGSGGIGSVYLAERILGGSPQYVALKVLAPHAAGPSFVERFHREEHILATLDHKSITRMLDAGVATNGQPYLVMEYVDGVHVDEFCNSGGLDLRQRIELFLQICDAMAYAHRNLIVHLDLKPSNVMVNSEGSVKLLDFGASKLIEPDNLLTTTVLTTPAYASPEQLRNEPVTTACDIYSLGAILFDLLAGRRPAGQKSAAAMFERAMNEAEPERLPDAVTSSTAETMGVSLPRLRQLLTGDLDTITAKCLRPRAKDRYVSVDALADDLRRYLDGRAVLARPQTAVYRIGKFVRRHRLAVMASVAGALLLTGSISYGAWKEHQALREARRSMSMQRFMSSMFTMANSKYSGKPTMTVNEFLNLAIRALPLYIHDRADLRVAQNSLAESLLVNGDTEDAQKVFAESERTAHQDGDKDAEAESLTYEGEIAQKRGDTPEYLRLTSRALDLSRSSEVSPSVQTTIKKDYAFYRDDNGPATDENLRLLREAVEESKKANLPPSHVADAVFDLAEDLEERGQLDQAEPLYREAIQIYSLDPAYTCNQGTIEGDLGYLDLQRGDISHGVAEDRKAFESAVRCQGADSSDAIYQQTYLAGALLVADRTREAIPMLQHVIAVREQDPGEQNYLSDPLYFLASAYIVTGKYTDAEKTILRVLQLTALQGVDPHGRSVANYNFIYAKALAGQHRDQEALPHARIADSLLSQHPSMTPLGKKRDAEAHQLLAKLEARLGATPAR